MIDYMIESRNSVVQHVFKYVDSTGIHIPVHFRRIINNIHNQLSIQSNSLVNITPFELYELLDDAYNKLLKSRYAKPTELFKIAFYYYLSPKT